MMVFGLIFWLAISALITWALTRAFPALQGPKKDPAEELVRGRFARGEIDVGEYERSLAILRKGPPQMTYEDYVRAAREQRGSEGRLP